MGGKPVLFVHVASGNLGLTVAEDDAVRVVGLVLQAAGKQPVADHRDRLPERIRAGTFGPVACHSG